MIQMKSGVYGGKDGMKRPGDGPFSLSEQEEARLVNRGIAEYVGASEGAPFFFDVIPPEESDEEEIKPLEEMSGPELRKLGAGYGLTFKGNASKVSMIEAIQEAWSQEDAPSFDAAEAVQA